MITLKETSKKIDADQRWWCIHLMNFVDDFRRYKNSDAVAEPFELGDLKMGALLASTAETLCDEIGIDPPTWLEDVPDLKEPWFVGDLERLKAISIVQSPVRFRIRKIFVLENFLSRV